MSPTPTTDNASRYRPTRTGREVVVYPAEDEAGVERALGAREPPI